MALLEAVWDHAPLARGKIGELTGLAPSSVTRLVRRLVDAGLIVETHASRSTGGRPAMLLGLSDAVGTVIAIDLSGVAIRGAIITATGKRLASRELLFEGRGQEAILRLVRQIAMDLMREADALKTRILAIGVSVPGTVDQQSGTILDVSHLDLRGVGLAESLRDLSAVEVYLEHDTVAAAYAEKRAGAGRASDHLIFISVGGGIGAGLVLGDRIYRGESGAAGEVGHIVVEFGGPACVCGKHGCLEAVASATVLLAAAESAIAHDGSSGLLQRKAATGGALGIADIVIAAEDGDIAAAGLLDREADYLARAIGTVTSLLDIRLVIIGGEEALLEDPVLRRIEAALPKYQLYSHRVDIVPAALGQDAALMGVAALSFRSVFGLASFNGTGQPAVPRAD